MNKKICKGSCINKSEVENFSLHNHDDVCLGNLCAFNCASSIRF